MKNLFILFSLLTILLSGCSDDKDQEKITDLSGKWMLEKYEVAFSDTQVHDCTSYNITVEVRSGETFIVNEYTLSDNLYFFSADEYPIIEMNGYSGIVVDESTYAIFINNNQLIVDLSPLDGPRYFFNKIKD